MAKKKKQNTEAPESVVEEAPEEKPVVSQPKNGTVFTGEQIKAAREEKGLSLKEISERTKISVATLQALEEERYEDMPNARVYVRGFVRCLAEEVGLDRDQVSLTYVPRWERWFEESGRRW